MADGMGRAVAGGADGRRPSRAERQTVIDADGRAKAYRPMPAPDRTAAVIAGLEAYTSGDFFEAHELMEPAWMGTDDPVERDLISGLIKLAAADVHGVRGNPRGVARNLEGARDRLRRVPDGDAVPHLSLDLRGLLDAIDRRLAGLAADRLTAPIPISWSSR
jgi:hypothetical protein